MGELNRHPHRHRYTHRCPWFSRMIGDWGERAYGRGSATKFNWRMPMANAYGEPPVANRLIRRLCPEQLVPRKRPPGKSRQSPRGAPPAPPRSAPSRKARSPSAASRGAVARARRPPPYIQCLQRSGRIAAWQVDGAYVRGNIDAEFGASGHHYSFGAIPRNEIWVDAEQTPDEQQLLIAQATIERRLMTRGMDYEAARTVAIAEERRQRLQRP